MYNLGLNVVPLKRRSFEKLNTEKEVNDISIERSWKILHKAVLITFLPDNDYLCHLKKFPFFPKKGS